MEDNNIWSSFLLLFFSANALISAYFLVTGKNPVYAVLLLIGVFVNVGALCLFFHADFLTYVSLIVYVGAISILFLFVVMMLDIKVSKYEKGGFDSWIVIGLAGLGLWLGESLCNLEELWYTQSSLLYMQWEATSSPQTLGISLYTNHIPDLLITGILLLVSMIGAILLSVSRGSSHLESHQFLCEQLSRNFENSILI